MCLDFFKSSLPLCTTLCQIIMKILFKDIAFRDIILMDEFEIQIVSTRSIQV